MLGGEDCDPLGEREIKCKECEAKKEPEPALSAQGDEKLIVHHPRKLISTHKNPSAIQLISVKEWNWLVIFGIAVARTATSQINN